MFFILPLLYLFSKRIGVKNSYISLAKKISQSALNQKIHIALSSAVTQKSDVENGLSYIFPFRVVSKGAAGQDEEEDGDDTKSNEVDPAGVQHL